MLNDREGAAIDALWSVTVSQDARDVPGAVVVADNILSHGRWDYVRHVRAVPRPRSMTLPIGKGLEVSRLEPEGAPS